MYYQPTKKFLHQVQKCENLMCQNTIKMPNTIISFKKQSENIFAFQSEFKMQLYGFTGRIIDQCHNLGIVFPVWNSH